MTSGIYSIKNERSGRAYVGSAINISRRWTIHRRLLNAGKHHSLALQRSWLKHGTEAFSFQILEACDRSELLVREQYWIDKLQAAHPGLGLNMRPKAGSQLGICWSPEVRQRMREGALKRDPATRINCKPSGAPWNKGKAMSPEFCKKIGDVQRGQKRGPRSAETRAKVGAANKGRPSPFKGLPRDPEIIKKSVRTKVRKRYERYCAANLQTC